MVWETVAGNDNLFVKLVESVKYIKEFFLGGVFANDELEVINN